MLTLLLVVLLIVLLVGAGRPYNWQTRAWSPLDVLILVLVVVLLFIVLRDAGILAMGVLVSPLWLHRLEQWDLECNPLVSAHWKTPNRSKRVFCLWFWGIQIGSFLLTTRAIHTRRRIYRWRA